MSWKEALLIKKACISISTGLRAIFFPIKKRIFATILSFTQHVKEHYTKYAQFIISARREISLCHRLLLWCFLFEVFGFLWWIRILNVIHFSIVTVCFESNQLSVCDVCNFLPSSPHPRSISLKKVNLFGVKDPCSAFITICCKLVFFLFFRTSRVLSLLVYYLERLLLDWLHDHQKKHFVLITAIVIWL